MHPSILVGFIVLAATLLVEFRAAFAAPPLPGVPVLVPPVPVVRVVPARQEKPAEPSALEYFNQALAAIEASEYENAENLLSKSIVRDKEFAPAYNQRGILKGTLGRDPESLDDFTRYIELRPMETAGYINRGNALSRGGNQEEALKDFLKAREIDKNNVNAWVGIGNTQLRSGHPREAIESDNMAISIDPKFHWPWNNRACAYLHLGEYRKALADENQAIKLAPEFGHHYYKRGLIEKFLGMKIDMQRDFAKARSLGFDVDGNLKASNIKI